MGFAAKAYEALLRTPAYGAMTSRLAAAKAEAAAAAVADAERGGDAGAAAEAALLLAGGGAIPRLDHAELLTFADAVAEALRDVTARTDELLRHVNAARAWAAAAPPAAAAGGAGVKPPIAAAPPLPPTAAVLPPDSPDAPMPHTPRSGGGASPVTTPTA